MLVVADLNRLHQSRNIGRDLHDVGTDPAVAGPGVDLIEGPHPAAEDPGGGNHKQGKADTQDRSEHGQFHECKRAERLSVDSSVASPPQRRMVRATSKRPRCQMYR